MGDNHLAVCDSHLLTLEDYNFDSGQHLHPTGKDQHQWYFYPSMTKNELLLFKQWDSAVTAKPSCFHSSFTDPFAPVDAPSRESIEVRVVALYVPTTKQRLLCHEGICSNDVWEHTGSKCSCLE